MAPGMKEKKIYIHNAVWGEITYLFSTSAVAV